MRSGIGEGILRGIERLLVLFLPIKRGVLFLAGEKICKRCTDAGDVWDKNVVEIQRPEEPTKFVSRFRRR